MKSVVGTRRAAFRVDSSLLPADVQLSIIHHQLMVLQRYKIKNWKSSILGYFFKIFSIEKSILQNIKTFDSNREDDANFKSASFQPFNLSVVWNRNYKERKFLLYIYIIKLFLLPFFSFKKTERLKGWKVERMLMTISASLAETLKRGENTRLWRGRESRLIKQICKNSPFHRGIS